MIFSFTISKKEKKKSTLEITIGGGKKDLKKKNTKKKYKIVRVRGLFPAKRRNTRGWPIFLKITASK